MSLDDGWDTVNCAVCGVEMVLRDALIAHFRKTHDSFSCPHGHKQSFLQPTDLERARASFKSAAERSARLEAEVRDLKRQLAKPKNKRRKKEST